MTVETATPYFYDFVIGPLIKRFHRAARKLACAEPGDKVLEVGCGTSIQLKEYSKTTKHLVGLDLDSPMVKRSKRNLGNSGHAMVADGALMPLLDNSFNLVLTSFVFHEMPVASRQPVLKDIKRVLSPEGRLILTDYCPKQVQGILGTLLWTGIRLIEWMAGKRHYDNFVSYCTLGGMKHLIEESEFTVEEQSSMGFGGVRIISLKAKD